MTSYVALLRAVNVGGRKLLMSDLKAIAEKLGLADVRTYIASGNLLFRSEKTEAELKGLFEAALQAHMGKPVGVMLRTGAEMAQAAAANPFPERPGNRVLVIFLDQPPPGDAAGKARHVDGERIALGRREIYVAYTDDGMGTSRLVIPAAAAGTGRNINTVQKLAEMAGAAP